MATILKTSPRPVRTVYPAAPVRKVLLVENHPATRLLVRSALRGACELLTAATDAQALDIYAAHRPDVVLLDTSLPHRAGDDTLRLLLEQDAGACIVAISGASNMAGLLRMVERGARGFMTLPFGAAEMQLYLRNQRS